MSARRIWRWSALAVFVAHLFTGGTALAHDDSYRFDLPAVQTFTEELTPSSPVLARTLLIDADEGAIIVSSISLSLNVTLQDPLGNVYPFGGAPQNGVESQAVPDPAEPGITGLNYMYSLTGVETGEWSVEVSQDGGVADTVELFFTLLFANSRGATLLGTNETYPLGTPVNLGFVLVDDGMVVGSIAPTGRVFKVGDPSFPDTGIDFLDDGLAGDVAAGDGIYTFQFTPPAAGQYQVNAKAEAGGPGAHYARSAAGRFWVVGPSGTLDGTFGDRSIDGDSDGYIDAIGVSPGIDVSDGGSYLVSVTLRADNGASLQASAVRFLPPGHHEPEVRFDSDDLRRVLEVSGPYAVELVVLDLQESEGVTTQDEKYDLGETAAYEIDDFEREAIAVLGVNHAVGVDLNANDLFDRLDVFLDLDILYAGTYSWSARLVDPLGTEVGFASGSSSLPAGPTTIRLGFAGEPIGTNGVDGPYEVRSFIMYGGGRSAISNSAGETGFFMASSFEGYVNPDTTPPVIAVNASPAVLWPPDHTMRDIELEVLVVDDMDPDPEVTLATVSSNEGDDQLGDGHTSDDIMIEDGAVVKLRAERSGTVEGPRLYTITYTATDDAGNTATGSAEVSVPHDLGDQAVPHGATRSVRSASQFITASNARGVCSPGDRKTVRWVSAANSRIQSVLLRVVNQDTHTETIAADGLPPSGWYTWEVGDQTGQRMDVILTATRDNARDTSCLVSTYTVAGGLAKEHNSMPAGQSEIIASPNPFNAATTITVELSAAGRLQVYVFDVLGRKVATLANRPYSAGTQKIVWNGRDDHGNAVASGVYLCRVIVADKEHVQKLVLLK